MKALIGDEIVGRKRIAAETADGKTRAIDGERGNDGIDARAIRQAGVHHRRGFIDASSDGGNDAIDDAHQVGVVAELNVGGFEKTLALDVHLIKGVDQNIGNRGIGEKRLERAQSENFIENFLGKPLALLQIHRRGFADDQFFENHGNFAAHIFAAHVGNAIQIDLLDQAAMDGCLNRS